jgi:hypothetical protein
MVGNRAWLTDNGGQRGIVDGRRVGILIPAFSSSIGHVAAGTQLCAGVSTLCQVPMKRLAENGGPWGVVFDTLSTGDRLHHLLGVIKLLTFLHWINSIL